MGAVAVEIARIRGIPIRVHITLLATFAILILSLGAAGIPAGLLLAGSVLLHELGHAIVAQRHGIPISSITLHLLGGTAAMGAPPASARQEILIAVAGPLVSLGLGIAFTALAMLGGGLLDLEHVDLLGYAAAVNFAMCLFNLLPALPMDGGRILRAALSTRLGPLRATRVSARISRILAGLFAVVALVGQLWSLLLIAGLLVLLVGNEERIAEQEEARRLSGLGLGPIHERREVLVDARGRRYVIITRLTS